MDSIKSNNAKMKMLWTKIEKERHNIKDSNVIKQYVKQYLSLTEANEILSWRKLIPIEMNSKPQENLNTKLATTNESVNYKNSTHSINTKQEIYDHYDVIKGINTWKYRIAKSNTLILDYLKKYNYSDSLKLIVFNKVKYVESFYNNKYDTTQTAGQNTMSARMNHILSLKKGAKCTRMELRELLGDVNGLLIYEDAFRIKDKCITEPIENLK